MEIEWQNPSYVSNLYFAQELLLWVTNTVKSKTEELMTLLIHTGKLLYVDLVGDSDPFIFVVPEVMNADNLF